MPLSKLFLNVDLCLSITYSVQVKQLLFNIGNTRQLEEGQAFQTCGKRSLKERLHKLLTSSLWKIRFFHYVGDGYEENITWMF